MGRIEAPLSNLIPLSGGISKEKYNKFLEMFCRSHLGVILLGVPDGSEGKVTTSCENKIALGNTSHGGFDNLILAFADPPEFIRNFGQRFNGEMMGLELVRAAMQSPDCRGILVNSATAETSIVITRQTASSLLERYG